MRGHPIALAAIALAGAGLPGTLHAQAVDAAHYGESVDRLDARMAPLSANGAPLVLRGEDASLSEAVVEGDAPLRGPIAMPSAP